MSDGCGRQRILHQNDDVQLYVSYDPTGDNSQAQAWDKMSRCIEDITSWMTHNSLQLNQGKTEMIVIQSPHHLRTYGAQSLTIGDVSVSPTELVRNLGVLFDHHMQMAHHVNSVVKTCNFHLYRIGRIRRYISTTACKTLVQNLVVARMDYACSLLTGIPSILLQKLQLIQNRAARIITRTKSRDHITPILHQLHWLPVYCRINFRLMVHVYKCLHNASPSYLTEMLSLYQPGRSLRSSKDDSLLTQSRTNKAIGCRDFRHVGPSLWNALPKAVRDSSTITIFKRNLKTFYFTQHYV